MTNAQYVARCLDAFCLDPEFAADRAKDKFPTHRATVYVSPKLTVKATRRSKPRKGERTQEFVVTIGQPNWHERQRIRTFIKAGEPFPVKRVQVQFRPKR